METVDDFLEHHGIKGMKWGVRRSETELNSVRYQTHKGAERVPLRIDANTQRIVEAGPKSRSSPHPDAANAAINRARVKQQSTAVLSNKELQDTITRMNLEQQYSRLTTSPQQSSAGKAFAVQLLKDHGPLLFVKGLSKMAEKSGDPKAIAAAKAFELMMKTASNRQKKKGN